MDSTKGEEKQKLINFEIRLASVLASLGFSAVYLEETWSRPVKESRCRLATKFSVHLDSVPWYQRKGSCLGCFDSHTHLGEEFGNRHLLTRTWSELESLVSARGILVWPAWLSPASPTSTFMQSATMAIDRSPTAAEALDVRYGLELSDGRHGAVQLIVLPLLSDVVICIAHHKAAPFPKESPIKS